MTSRTNTEDTSIIIVGGVLLDDLKLRLVRLSCTMDGVGIASHGVGADTRDMFKRKATLY